MSCNGYEISDEFLLSMFLAITRNPELDTPVGGWRVGKDPAPERVTESRSRLGVTGEKGAVFRVLEIGR